MRAPGFLFISRVRLSKSPPVCHPAPLDLMTFSSSAPGPVLAEWLAVPLDGVAADGSAFSSISYRVRQERLAVPRVLGKHSSRRVAAVMTGIRSFSSEIERVAGGPSDGDANRTHLVKIFPPEGEEEVIHPYKGVIRPDLGHFRPLSVMAMLQGEAGPRLPLVTQTSFYHRDDVHLTQWETPMGYMIRSPSLAPVGYGNPLVDPDGSKMLTTSGRFLWKSAVDLVTVNRLRGYCISKALVEENLVVSSLHGTFGLKRPLFDDLPADPNDFIGYKALRRLFITLMVKRYGESILHDLLPDVLDWLSVLANPRHLNGRLPTYHACLLTDEGRAWFSVRLAQILTSEVKADHVSDWKARSVLEDLHGLSVGIDDLHPFFGALRDHSNTTREKMSDGPAAWQPDVLPEELEMWEKFMGGRWVVMMNRHGFLHSHSGKLFKIAGCRYTTNNVIDLLHCKLSQYLPAAQVRCDAVGLWDRLDMDRYFPKTVIYPRITY